MNVTIVDDLVDEPLEYFNFTLERTPDLDTRISLNPVDGRIAIIDNDGKYLNLYEVGHFNNYPIYSPSSNYCWLYMSSRYTLHLRGRAWQLLSLILHLEELHDLLLSRSTQKMAQQVCTCVAIHI